MSSSRTERGRRVPRLLLVSPGRLSPDATAALVEEALAGGVDGVLLREPHLTAAERGALARRLATACAARDALLIVHHDAALARSCGAAGVHTGDRGPAVAGLRAQAPGLLVGRSAHWPPGEEDARADYLLLSPFRPTPASQPRPLLTETQVRAVCARADLGPVLALGGLTAADVPALPGGLAGLAVLRAICEAPSPRAAAAALRAAIDAHLAAQASS